MGSKEVLKDSLDDSSTLPELSFDDLLDSSPIKKNGKSAAIDDDPLEFELERSKTHKDDSLNTPGPKKSHMIPRTISNNSITSKAIPIRTNPMKIGNALSASFSKNTSGGGSGSSGGNTSAPILLNTKNVLPKMATQITNNSIKITPKTAAGSGGVVQASASGVSMACKTAVRTSTGQLIYIQKNPSNPSTGAIKAALLSGGGSGGGGGGGSSSSNKPVTIQVMRNADGNFVPVKTSSSAAGTNGKNTTLTLSPTTLGPGKRIVNSSGNQVLIKSATTSSAAAASANTNPNTALKGAVVKQATVTTTTSSGDLMAKPKTIVVQSNTGKQIIVSNPNLVKLSPKTQTTTAAASGAASAATTSASGTGGQLHAIQIAGKQGVQYVRVMPTSKGGGTSKSSIAVTSAAGSSTSMARTLTSTTTTTVTGSAPVKILNNLPQKFTVVQKGSGGTKVLVAQKKDPNSGEYSPIASKVQKTIVAMPSLRAIGDEKPKQPPTKEPQATNSAANQQSLMRKHKISEINCELKRITSASAEDSGPPDIKKPAPNNRLVVISSNAPKILNNSIQQPGRVTTSATSSSFTSSGAIQVQGTKYTPTSSSSAAASSSSSSVSTTVGNKLYTILKPSGQANPSKLYSVLKTSTSVSSMSTTTQPSFTTPAQRPLLNKQTLLQQQQKIFHLKQLQKSKVSSETSLIIKSSSSTFCPVKIKEEPLEFYDNSTTTTTTTTATEKHKSSLSLTSSSFTAPSPSTSASATALQPLSIVSAEIKEDPNKIDLVGGVRRKHCNCSKSQCLKLYCDCFANGEFCQDCTCKDCCNNLDNEDERQRAIKSCLERNPSAFKPKITSSSDQGDMRLHNKGCNCKRSGCLKNYCECYEAKIPCSSNCKCVGCRNVEDRPDLDLDPVDAKVMASIANVSAMSTSQKRTYDKAQRDSMGNVAIKTEKLGKDTIKMEAGTEANNDNTPPADKKQQCNFITQEVVDATIQCMVTQADECEKNGLPAYQMEKMVMEELGRCLVEIIDFSIRNTDTSYSQD